MQAAGLLNSILANNDAKIAYGLEAATPYQDGLPNVLRSLSRS